MESAAALFEAFGGEQLAIPYQLHGVRFERIAQVIGQEKAAVLVSRAAGDELHIPVLHRFKMRKTVHAEIEARLKQGQSAEYIALTYRTPPMMLTSRTVRNIKAAMLKKRGIKCAPKPNIHKGYSGILNVKLRALVRNNAATIYRISLTNY